jgi:Ca-activated chloride channel family protein
MPELAYPWVTLLLVVPALLAWRRGKGRGAPFSDLRLLTQQRASASWGARYGPFALRLLGLATLILALMGPRWPDLKTRLETEGVAILLAVDVSGSMGERDFFWGDEAITRLEAVQRVYSLFLAGGQVEGARFEGRPTDLAGVVRFATRPEVACPLTLQHRALLSILENEQPRAAAGESETNISDAIALATARLENAGTRRKVLVLLSDGEHNVSTPASGWTPIQAAQVAASLGVIIHSIDAGTDELRPGESPDSRAAAVETLRAIAEVTGGDYFPASDTQALASSLRKIDRMERAPITSFQYRRYHEGYPWLGLASFLLFLLAEALRLTVWRRYP